MPIGFWAARRLTRPLRAARDAANQMADGSRSVTLRPEGPVEIADIAVSLNRLNAALVVSEGRQREFLLSVSHELRTPLTAVKGYAEALSDNVIPPEDVARTGGIVAAEAARLDRLVQRPARSCPAGGRRLPDGPGRARPRRDRRGRRSGVAWTARRRRASRSCWSCPTQPVIVRTDPIRVRQIIDNLAENALRVSPPDSVIVLAVRREGQWGVVEVRDSGPGLTVDDVSVAFEPGVLHERYRGVRPVGTGLGLALVGKLAEGLGGSAEAGRADEGGARFTVRLPV